MTDRKLRKHNLRPHYLASVCLLVLLVGCASPMTPDEPEPTESATMPADAASPLPVWTPAWTATHIPSSSHTTTPAPTFTATPDPIVRFAVIGDFGDVGDAARDVANLVDSWNPEFVITTGDNNYPAGEASTIDANIGQYYHEYIHPYTGSYGEGAEINRFFPVLGNHDWITDGAQAYFDYFTLPGNERYYDVVWEHVHLFALDNLTQEPDGVGMSSRQAAWLRERLAASASPWKIVYMHAPPYSSGLHGSIDWARWPYREWGATAVLSGHDHTYERILVDGFPYFVNGLGGGAIYYFETVVEGSQVRFNGDYGAMLVEASPDFITFQFVTRAGLVIDSYTIDQTPG